MAVKPDSNEAFLREVDEGLRRDQAATFWRRYGLWVVVAVIAGLAAFAGYLYWQHRQREASAAAGLTLQSAYDDLGANKPEAAAKPLAELAASDIDGYRVMALYSQADLLLLKNDLAGAAAKFAQVANDASLAQPFRDLALIRQTTAEFDTLRPEVVVARLRGLATAGNPWFGSAGELVAAGYLRQGRRDLAGQLFGRIAKDEDVPPSIRQRAIQMAGVLGVDAIQGIGGGGNEGKATR